MYWHQVLVQHESVSKHQPMPIYCNTGSRSAQAGFRLRVAGWEIVRFLQGGMEGWKAKRRPRRRCHGDRIREALHGPQGHPRQP